MNFVNLFTILIIIIILIFTYLSIQKIKQIYIIKKSVKKSIIDIDNSTDFIIINGAVRQHTNILHSPIYNKECIFYKYKIYSKTHPYLNKIGLKWKQIEKGFDSCDFIIEDKSGTAYINKDDSNFLLNNKIEETFKNTNIPEIIFKNSNFDINLNNIAKEVKLHEKMLKSGENVYVVGKFNVNKNNKTTIMNKNKVYIFNEEPKKQLKKLYIQFLLLTNTLLIIIVILLLII